MQYNYVPQGTDLRISPARHMTIAAAQQVEQPVLAPALTDWSDFTDSDMRAWNQWAATSSPDEIVRELAQTDARIMLSTSFGPESAVALHLLHRHLPETPVVWVDSGYNTPETCEFVQKMQRRFELNLHIYRPNGDWELRGDRDLATAGVVEQMTEQERDSLSQHFKREPFDRAIADLRPEIWLAGIRRDETEFRRSLDVFSQGRPGVVRVAPLFYTGEQWTHDYLHRHELPGHHPYRDIVKGEEAQRECGLHDR